MKHWEHHHTSLVLFYCFEILRIDLVASTQRWELFISLLLKIHVVFGVDFNNILTATIVLLVLILSAADRSIKFWLHDSAVMCSHWGCPIKNEKCRNPVFFTKGWFYRLWLHTILSMCVNLMQFMSIAVDMSYFVWINLRAYFIVYCKRPYMQNLFLIYMQL